MIGLNVHGLPSSSRSRSCSCGCSSEVSRLRDRVEELEELIGLKVVGSRAAGLSVTQWLMAGLLLKRPLISREFAFRAIYGGRPESDQPTDIRTVDQHMCRMKRRLKAYGIVVKNTAHEGYYLDASSRRRLKELVDGPNHD
jgi:hypothetical protein